MITVICSTECSLRLDDRWIGRWEEPGQRISVFADVHLFFHRCSPFLFAL